METFEVTKPCNMSFNLLAFHKFVNLDHFSIFKIAFCKRLADVPFALGQIDALGV